MLGYCDPSGELGSSNFRVYPGTRQTRCSHTRRHISKHSQEPWRVPIPIGTRQRHAAELGRDTIG